MQKISRMLRRLFFPMLAYVAGSIATLGCLRLGVAQAAARYVEPAVATPPVPDPMGWLLYVGVTLAAIGGLVKILEVLQVGLTWLAPRTKWTGDDTLRDDVKLLHDKLDHFVTVVETILPVKPMLSVANNVTSAPESGKVVP